MGLKAAIIVEGKTFTGYSHGDVICNMEHGLDIDSRVEGFLTSEGNFIDRCEAFTYAKEHNLLIIDIAEGYQSLQSWMLK